jgi:hypothetical protein
MGRYRSLGILIALAIRIAFVGPVAADERDRTLSLSWDKEMLTIRGQHLPGGAVFLDTEQYQGKLFDYAKQRDATRHAWDEYAAEARRRGRELMTALQDECPDLTVFVTFGHSLPWKQGEHGKTPLAECRYGLLVPFLDGMIEAARGRTRIVDGHEMSYGYRDADAFAKARRAIKEGAATLAADPAAYRRVVSAGFGLWLDYDWRKEGWDTADLEKNHFSPSRFESSLHAALEHADELVWI